MWSPTFMARAVTGWNWLHVSEAHTAKVRKVPGVGGPAGCGVAARAGAVIERAGVPLPKTWVCPRRRRNPSNSTAAERGEEGGARYWASGAAVAAGTAVRSTNGELSPNVPA